MLLLMLRRDAQPAMKISVCASLLDLLGLSGTFSPARLSSCSRFQWQTGCACVLLCRFDRQTRAAADARRMRGECGCNETITAGGVPGPLLPVLPPPFLSFKSGRASARAPTPVAWGLTVYPEEAFIEVDVLVRDAAATVAQTRASGQRLEADVDGLEADSDDDVGDQLVTRESAIRTRDGGASYVPTGAEVGHQDHGSQRQADCYADERRDPLRALMAAAGVVGETAREAGKQEQRDA